MIKLVDIPQTPSNVPTRMRSCQHVCHDHQLEEAYRTHFRELPGEIQYETLVTHITANNLFSNTFFKSPHVHFFSDFARQITER